MTDWIRVRGVRTHNLKHIGLDIPRGKIIALVGVSGAGKSSLAFHTLYAEGYSRYMESISPYIRQFLDKIEKPPLDGVTGLPPAVAVRHRRPARNPRSTVATSIDLYDYFRILYARGGHFFCPGCGRRLRRWSLDEIVADLLAHPGGDVLVAFDYRGEIPFLVNRGYYHYLHNGKPQRLRGALAGRNIQVVLDEVTVSQDQWSRLFEAVDRAIALGRERVVILRNGQTVFYAASLRCPHCNVTYTDPDENLFSFNSARGACPRCRGYGDLQEPDPKKIFSPALSLAAGAIRPLRTAIHRSFREQLLAAAKKSGIDIHQPFRDLSLTHQDFILDGGPGFPGVSEWFRFLKGKQYKVQARVLLSRYSSYQPCPECRGARLNAEALAYRVKGLNIAELSAMTIRDVHRFFADLDAGELAGRVTPDVFREIQARLQYLDRSGLGYLNLDRLTFTLSRGEHQRLNMAFILGSTLSDSLLILDQPSADIHPAESRHIMEFLRGLREAGNTVIMIEHDPDLIRAADWVVELGPGAGNAGGKVVFSDTRADFLQGKQTLTQQRIHCPITIGAVSTLPASMLEFRSLSAHNLTGFDVGLPRAGVTMVCGVSGAGKTSLLRDELAARPCPQGIASVEYVDPEVNAAVSRSGVAAFMRIHAPIREWFADQPAARRLGYTPGHFSANSPRGRCPVCRGKGGRELEMQFLPSVWIPCEDCNGTGLRAESIKIRVQGKNLVEWLEMTASEAWRLLKEPLPQVARILAAIEENGLGYLRLSQTLGAMSEGERQRLKLCRHLVNGKASTLYLVDDPSYGLHPVDLDRVKDLFRRLTASGHTVVVADHNLELLAGSDWVIELGPGGGDRGGRLLFCGTVADFLRHGKTLTAKELKKKCRP
ncbi:MAG TPA: hypothetical protein ENN40_03510 [Candidatus Aminicenantes bacterium]|nr:hypothetical protein [Candidatus Aminicenantes bacterium]